MPDIESSSNNPSINNLLLNTAIGFLSVLLLGLLIALSIRVIYPRIANERVEVDSQLISSVIQVEVLNGCGIAGIANRFTGLLRSNGFDVVETGNFDHFNLEESIVISRSGVTENARQIATALGIKEINILTEQSPDFYLDVTVVIGHDFEQLNSN